MSDSTAGWLSRSIDYTSLGCTLFGAEQGIQSLAIYVFDIKLPIPTVPWRAWVGALVVGYVLSLLGDKGPKVSRWIWEILTRKALKEQNQKLQAEIESLRTKPVAVPPSSLQFLDLGAPQPSAQTKDGAASEVLKNAPRLRVELSGAHSHREDVEGRLGNLVFLSDKPAIIKNVGDLHSAERYESSYEFSLMPSTIPVVDKDRPGKCRMLGLRQRRSAGMYAPDIRALVDILRDGTPQSMDSVVIDYDDEDGNGFSRRFALTRNQDDSIAWIPDPVVTRGNTDTPEAAPLDLAELRHKLYLADRFPETYKAWQTCAEQLEHDKERFAKLKAQYSSAFLAAQLNLLVDEAQHLQDWLGTILSENQSCSSPLDLSRPLQYSLICLQESSGESITLPWQRIRLMAFRDGYSSHRFQLSEKNFANYDWAPPKLPIDLEVKDVMSMFVNYRKALREKIDELATPFTKALHG